MKGSKWCMLATVFAALLSQGCMVPSVRIEHVAARRSMQGEQLSAVAFHIAIASSFCEGQQLICRVSVVDRDLYPKRSVDGRYELAEGQVGAQRALLVRQPQERFPDVKLEVPLRQFHFQETDLPAIAFVGVYAVDGRCLAQTACRVPVVRDDLFRTSAAPPAVGREHWFVNASWREDPTLWGPFPSVETASQAASWFDGEVFSLEEAAYVWIVPIESSQGERVDVAGPCRTLEDVESLHEDLTGVFSSNPESLSCGPPEKIQLRSWIARTSALEQAGQN